MLPESAYVTRITDDNSTPHFIGEPRHPVRKIPRAMRVKVSAEEAGQHATDAWRDHVIGSIPEAS